MKNRRGDPILRFRLWHVFLMSIWIAVVLSLVDYPHFAAGAGGLMVVVYLHHLSLGRTSPLAAFAFVFSTVVLAAGVGLPYLVREVKGYKQHIDMISFFTVMPCYGMAVAGVVAVIAAYNNRDLWFNHL